MEPIIHTNWAWAPTQAQVQCLHWANLIQQSITNLGLVPQFKPKAIKAFTNLGFSFGSNPLKSKSILILSLGLSSTCSSSSPQEDYDGESGGERDIAGGPRSWPRLPTFRAASTNAICAVFAALFQRRHPGVEPAAAAWHRRPRTEPAAAAFTGA